MPHWDGWRSYDESRQIVNAVRYIYDRGCRLGVDAIVINLSIGAWAGRHDGRSRVERGIGEMLADAEASQAAVVARARSSSPAPAMPESTRGIGTAGVDAARPATFDWIMQRRDPTQNKLEIWYEAGADGDIGHDVRVARRGR